MRTLSSRVAWARLGCIVAAMAIVIWQWPTFQWLPVLLIGLCLALFLRLVVISVNTARKIALTRQLIAINEEELAIAKGIFIDRFDGLPFLPSSHHYAHDLDLFGRASLYQFTNRAESFAGRQHWAQWLLKPAEIPEVLMRQSAAKALAPALQWRQQLQAVGRLEPITQTITDRLLHWEHLQDSRFAKPTWRLIRWAGPAISITLLILYIVNAISFSAFNAYLVLFFIITSYISKLATPAYQSLGKMADEINTLSQSLLCIEEMPVGGNEWLNERQRVLHGTEKASVAILQLNGILKRLDYRLNPLAFIPLNILFFWDLQQMLILQNWQQKYADKLPQWLKVLAEIESISTVAALHYNYPDWTFPVFVDTHGTVALKGLGHPLIPEEKRIVSDFDTRGVPMVNIITGSNMAGKSTFLRSVGLAMVMGQAGSPVCALGATLSAMQVMSSMRIADNLEESTSTFYAELKKLKGMIEAVNKGEKVLLLMDEILRGTNSLDRHKGSKALVEQLIHHHAAGMVATHDLELAAVEQDHPEAIRNYHFDVQVAGDELFFDYALKNGVCQSMNASLLMRKIGIELPDD